MEEAQYLCERIVIPEKGKILAQGTLNEILAANNSYEIIDFSFNETIGNINFINKSIFDKVDWDDKTQKARLFVTDLVAQLPKLMDLVQSNGLSLQTLECHKMILDDLFIEMTGRRLDQ